MSRRRKLTKDAQNQTVDIIDSSNHAQMRDAFTIMNQMRKERLLCDVILSVGNVEVPAHKTVLAATSRYFYANLVLSKENQGECRIALPSTISPEALEMLVNYMYNGQIQITPENVECLLPAAHMFMLKAVMDDCCKLLQNQLTPKDCLRIKSIAEKYECSELLKKIQYCIDEHFSEIVDTEQFRTLQFQQLVLLISRDTLTIPAEEKLYEGVMSWLKYDLKARKKYLMALMQHVRLPLIPVAYVVEHIVHEPLLKGDLKSKDFIIAALQHHFLQKNTIDADVDLQSANRSDSMVLAVIGGVNLHASKTMEYFDFDEGRWSEVMEVPHEVFGGAITIDDKIFALSENNSTGGIAQYNVTSNQWLSINLYLSTFPLSMVGTYIGNCLVTTANDCIFIASNRSVVKFNTSCLNLSWSTIPFPSHMGAASGIAVIDNRIYVIGGLKHNAIEVYNEDLKHWSTLPLHITTRYNMGIGVIGQTIYIIGGHDYQFTFKSVETLDTTTNCFKQIASLNIPRESPGVVTFNNLLYVVGGSDCSGRYSSSIEVYDPKTNTWTLLPAFMSVERLLPAVTFVKKSKLSMEQLRAKIIDSDTVTNNNKSNQDYKEKHINVIAAAISVVKNCQKDECRG